MTTKSTLPPVSNERPLFTSLVCIGVLANLVVVALIIYFLLAS